MAALLKAPLHAFESYCIEHSSPVQDEALQWCERETHLRTLAPQMLCGPYVGSMLTMLGRMLNATKILEIGTFTGYGTIHLARGLAKGGRVHTIEIQDEYTTLMQAAWQKANVTNSIQLHIGDALQLIPTFDEKFDLIFLDAGKLDYLQYWEIIVPIVRSGGVIAIDNVLWDGKVTGPENDLDTVQIRAFNQLVVQDPRVHCIMLPIRDGLTIAQKISEA